MFAREPDLNVSTPEPGGAPPYALDEVPTLAVALRLCWQRRAGVALALAPTVVILALGFLVFGSVGAVGLFVAFPLAKLGGEPVALSYTLGACDYRPEVAFPAWQRALSRLWVTAIALLVIWTASMSAWMVLSPVVAFGGPYVGWLSFVIVPVLILVAALIAAPVIAFEEGGPQDVLRRAWQFAGVVRREPSVIKQSISLLVPGAILVGLYLTVFVVGLFYLGLMALMNDTEHASFLIWWLPVVLVIGPAALTLWSTWTLAWMTLLYAAFRRSEDRATLAPARAA